MSRYLVVQKRNYGCAMLFLDVFLSIITGGLWIIWIIIREWRYSRRVY